MGAAPFMRVLWRKRHAPLRKVVLFPSEESLVLDIAYIVGTMLFFALMLAYVRGCAALGKRTPGDVAAEERVP